MKGVTICKDDSQKCQSTIQEKCVYLKRDTQSQFSAHLSHSYNHGDVLNIWRPSQLLRAAVKIMEERIKMLASIAPWNVRNLPFHVSARRVEGLKWKQFQRSECTCSFRGGTKRKLNSNNNMMAMAVNLVPSDFQLLLLLNTYVIVCYISENLPYREKALGKAEIILMATSCVWPICFTKKSKRDVKIL